MLQNKYLPNKNCANFARHHPVAIAEILNSLQKFE